MTGTVQIDKVGRLVIPKNIREAAGMHAGVDLDIELRGDEIILRCKPTGKGLHKDRGLWAHDSGAPLTTEEVNRWISNDRERRVRHLSVESLEP